MSKFSAEKQCVLSFDEMNLKASLSYDSKRDIVEGLHDLGKKFPSQTIVADHVLVFYLLGLPSGWKQPYCDVIT